MYRNLFGIEVVLSSSPDAKFAYRLYFVYSTDLGSVTNFVPWLISVENRDWNPFFLTPFIAIYVRLYIFCFCPPVRVFSNNAWQHLHVFGHEMVWYPDRHGCPENSWILTISFQNKYPIQELNLHMRLYISVHACWVMIINICSLLIFNCLCGSI